MNNENHMKAAPVHQLVGCRPSGVTRYMWKKYQDDFAHGTQFWTSVDGSEGELVILPSAFTLEVLSRHFDQYNLVGKTVRAGFVCRERVGREFFDDYFGPSQGVVWRFSEQPTPFPVHIVDPFEASNSTDQPSNAAPTKDGK